MAEIQNLNDEQQKAVEHGEGPLLIIAGAGTGKTTVVTQRIKHLILEKKINPSEILALTFTEKAASEMEERVDVALPYGYTQLWISTFHAFCDRVLRDEAVQIGLNPGFKLSTEAESMLFLKKNLFTLQLNYFRPLGNPYKFLQGLLQHFSRLKDDDITPEEYQKFAEKMTGNSAAEILETKKTLELAKAYKTYEELKAAEGVMDFGDLNANVLKLFRMRPNILRIYQEKFRYILVDEFQDTNFAQNELAMLLAGEKRNINVVGDDDQSIYRWRGAAIANIIHFRKRYPDTAIVTLTKNYRSSEPILSAAYQMIQHNNPDRLEVREKINKKLQALGKHQSVPVEFLYSNRADNEAELVKDTIKDLVKTKGLAYRDIAILVRANDHSQPFTRAFERARIPYQFLGPGRLYHQEEIKDLIAYMKVLYNFEDNASFYRILTMPFFQIEARDIAAILNFSQKQSITVFETCERIDDLYVKETTKDAVKHIIAMIKKHLEHVPRESAGQVLYYFFEDSGLLQLYLAAEKPHEEKRAQNIARFFERLKSFEANHDDASIFAVVDWIELSMELGESPLASDMDWAENDAVNILTVHSSKGLEFPAVFLIGLVTQRFPSRDRKEQIPISDQLIKETLPEGDYNLQEERRLFYVGMTRAKQYLYLSAAQFYGEGRRERKISPFVFEALGEAVMNKVLQKQKATQYVQQLSLLDLANEKIQLASVALEPEKARILQPISYISYSQLQSFDICPLHYKLRYVLKIPPSPTPAQSFGISMHAALKEYYTQIIQGAKPGEIAIEALLQKNWITIGYDNKDHATEAFHHGRDVLLRFITQHGNESELPLALETPFSFFIPNSNGNTIKISGRIDRVDPQKDGGIEIIDYKTGQQIPDPKKLANDLQLSVYALAASEIHDQVFNRTPEQVTLSLWYIDEDIKISTTRSAEQLILVKQQLLEKIKLIETSDFRCSGSILCKNCEYKMLCQTYS